MKPEDLTDNQLAAVLRFMAATAQTHELAVLTEVAERLDEGDTH